MNVGFVGLGGMGSEMARNLIRAGHQLTVFNRTKARAEALAAIGARSASSPGEAASGVDVVITMLADDHATEELVLGQGGILHLLRSGGLHVCMSTISVALSRRMAVAHEKKGQEYVAAPVFGRPEAAASAKLFIVAAGSAEQLEFCRPLFDAIGQKTFVAGDDAPAAHVIKLAGNFLISTVIESLAESFALIRKSGVDPDKFLEIMTNSLFAAPVYKVYGALVAAQKFEPIGFKLPLGLKDNRLVMQAAEDAGVPMPMASLIRDRFITAIAMGLSEADWSAIASIAHRNAGL